MAIQQKIIPNLWFDHNAKEVVDFYVSVFPNSRIINTLNYPKTAEEGLADFQEEFAGQVLSIDFELDGVRFTAINASSEFKFNEAVSFMIACKDQEEIDYYWEKLSADSESEVCGWCKDKFGLSWQVTPENMDELIKKPGAYANMMKMGKIVIAEL